MALAESANPVGGLPDSDPDPRRSLSVESDVVQLAE